MNYIKQLKEIIPEDKIKSAVKTQRKVIEIIRSEGHYIPPSFDSFGYSPGGYLSGSIKEQETIDKFQKDIQEETIFATNLNCCGYSINYLLLSTVLNHIKDKVGTFMYCSPYCDYGIDKLRPLYDELTKDQDIKPNIILGTYMSTFKEGTDITSNLSTVGFDDTFDLVKSNSIAIVNKTNQNICDIDLFEELLRTQ